MDCLNFAWRIGGHYRGVHRPFSEWAAAAASVQAREALVPQGLLPVLDLGSGGAGPVEAMIRAARDAGTTMPRIVLSDRYPDTRHFADLAARLGDSALGFVPEPVSALEADRLDFRLRCLFAAFHHFRPQEARAVLAGAARHADGFFIVEPFERTLRHFLMVFLSGPFVYMLAPFFSRRFCFRKLLVSTLIPIVPLMVMFDGCVSVLRVYTPREILSLFPDGTGQDFETRAGTLPYMRVCRASYFYAFRRASRQDERLSPLDISRPDQYKAK